MNNTSATPENQSACTLRVNLFVAMLRTSILVEPPKLVYDPREVMSGAGLCEIAVVVATLSSAAWAIVSVVKIIAITANLARIVFVG